MCKKLMILVVSLTMMFGLRGATAATPTQTYVFLNYYDQLTNYQGKPGNYFVRDAAGTTTGQHGDPTVNKGWAIYIWNLQGQTNGTGKWTKIAEEEQLDATINEMLLSQYATKAHVQQMVDSVYTELYKKADAEETQRLNALIGTLDRRVENAENSVAVMQNDIGRVETKTDAAAQAVSSIREQIRDITGEGLTDISNKVDQLVVSVNTLNTHLNTIEQLLSNMNLGEDNTYTINHLRNALKDLKQAIGPKPDPAPSGD